MSIIDKAPEFRFYYITNRYLETIDFYKHILKLQQLRSWDRGRCDKGTIFKSPNGVGLIEIEEGGDIPSCVGGGIYIEVEDVDFWYQNLTSENIKIIQPLANTSYGHRSFKFEDPNKLVIGLFQYIKI